jgi:FKBP-type peptidyl-prolyl cis-trans isomerase FkpA/FKBP-type peptidyl-prolyl cis-trans isomerase FklB
MRTRIFVIFSVLAVIFAIGCSRKPKSQREQVSYTVGAQFGKSLKAQDLDLDANAIAHGLEDGLKGEKLALTDEEMQGAMMKLAEERQKEMKAQAEKNKGEATAFLDKNKSAEGVKVTASGLQYKIVKEGDGHAPTPDDIVVVNYKGTLIDGKEFDSSFKRNMPAEFPVKGVIPGWTEGLQMMKKGGKFTFYVPPELAYGDRPRQNIPPNSVLIFDVDLLDIKPIPKPPGAAQVKPGKAAKGKKK